MRKEIYQVVKEDLTIRDFMSILNLKEESHQNIEKNIFYDFRGGKKIYKHTLFIIIY